MTDDEIMRQLSRAVRDDDVLAVEEMVTVGQQEHPEWDWPFLATVLWIQRGQVQEEPPRQPAWRRWLLAGRRWPPVRTGLAFGAASGNPAPGRGPAGCLPAGLPPGRRPRQGRYPSLRDRLRRPLTRPSSSRPGDTGRPGRART